MSNEQGQQADQDTAQRNDIHALRATLFDTLNGLKNNSLDIDRAKAINETAQTLINSLKVEVDFAKATGLQPSSEFIPTVPLPKPEPRPALQNLRDKGVLPQAQAGVTHPAPGVTLHKIRG